MGDDHDRAVRFGDELLESIETGEVQVVRRLVEQEHVEAAEQDRGQRGAGRLTPGEHRDLDVEAVGGQPEVGTDRADAGVEIVTRRARGTDRARRCTPRSGSGRSPARR